MGKYTKKLKEKDVGSIGIGAMIVFIAMVLVAGIAASVLIQTSTRLESQAMATGQETTAEVSSGLEVVNVEGYKGADSKINLLAVTIRPRAGSKDIDLAETIIEISDSATKNFLIFNDTYTDSTGVDGDLYARDQFTVGSTNFSIIVLEDADGSCSGVSSAVINSGDYVVLGINITKCFGGFDPRDDVWGLVLPEEGAPGVINFKCPASFTGTVIELQ
jgi:flagellin FlaB